MSDFVSTIQQGRAEYREPGQRIRVYPTAKAGRYDVQADLFSGTFGGELEKQEICARLRDWGVSLETGWQVF